MGNRLHVARKHTVEYASIGYFNWQTSEFHNFLNCLNIEVCGSDRCSDPEPWDFEIDKEVWKKGISKLKEETADDELKDAIQALGYSQTEIVEIMEKYLAAADQDSDYLYFSFF